MFAVCGGGSDAAAITITALAVGAWILLALLVIRVAEDRRERIALLVLAIASSAIGPAVLFGPLRRLPRG